MVSLFLKTTDLPQYAIPKPSPSLAEIYMYPPNALQKNKTKQSLFKNINLYQTN